MGLNLDYIHGQTPLDEDEKEGLLIPTVATRGELDEFEQANIEDAIEWAIGTTATTQSILTQQFICRLHKRMLGEVWEWAGQFRKTDKNLGIDKWKIPVALRTLCDNTLYWVEHETYNPFEIVVRFKHDIVNIHCFPNGNGRHSRLMADIIISKVFDQPIFTWGANNLVHQSDSRKKYLLALRQADNGNLTPLLQFARS